MRESAQIKEKIDTLRGAELKCTAPYLTGSVCIFTVAYMFIIELTIIKFFFGLLICAIHRIFYPRK